MLCGALNRGPFVVDIERQRGGEGEGEEGWQRASPGGCVETPARTVVMSKSRPHPVWTPTPTLVQSSRGDHRDLPAGIFVINGFWPPPTRLQPGAVRDHLRDEERT